MNDMPLRLMRGLPPEALGLRAIGGNVLLRRVKQDSSTLLVMDRQPGVLQVGEVCGMGERWTENRPWSPPFSQQDKARSEQLEREQLALYRESERPKGLSAWKPMWRFPDSSTPRPPESSFTEEHAARVASLRVGDLVVFSQPRVYDAFRWMGYDILLYPGCWIMGVIDGEIAARPRRYEDEPA